MICLNYIASYPIQNHLSSCLTFGLFKICRSIFHLSFWGDLQQKAIDGRNSIHFQQKGHNITFESDFAPSTQASKKHTLTRALFAVSAASQQK